MKLLMVLLLPLLLMMAWRGSDGDSTATVRHFNSVKQRQILVGKLRQNLGKESGQFR
jgi:hypothetical protein